MSKIRERNELEKNPVGLPQEAVSEIIPELDAHLASLFVLYHQYYKHHWNVEGPQFRDVHLFLEENYNALHAAVDEVAERITLLGGLPTANPVEQAKIAYIKHEDEGVYSIRESLERDMKAEAEIAKRIRQTIRLADDHSDFGTKKLLQEVLVGVEDRAHHCEHFLGEDTLQTKEAIAAS